MSESRKLPVEVLASEEVKALLRARAERGSKGRRVRRAIPDAHWVAGLLVCLCVGIPAHALEIVPQNVKRLAVYGVASDFGQDLPPNQLVFNVTRVSEIAAMISSIDFGVQRDCSDLGARTNARVYVEFQDRSVEVYELYGMRSHFGKVGLRGSCYYVSPAGQLLFSETEQ